MDYPTWSTFELNGHDALKITDGGIAHLSKLLDLRSLTDLTP